MADASSNFMLPKDRSSNSNWFPTTLSSNSQGVTSSLALSKTPAQRPYRGAIPIKPAWSPKNFGRLIDDELDKENESVGEGSSKPSSREGRRTGRHVKMRRDDSDSDDDDGDILEESPQVGPDTLEAGKLEDMLNYLDVVASDNDESDDDEPPAIKDKLGRSIVGHHNLAGGTAIPVARRIPVGDERFYILGDDEHGSGRKKGRRGGERGGAIATMILTVMTVTGAKRGNRAMIQTRP